MKRKRGNKKEKSKKTPFVGDSEAVSDDIKLNAEENSGLDDCEKDESNSEMETEEPSSIPTDEEVKVASTSEVIKTKPPERLVYGRVKVKIKTPKILETQLASSDIDNSGQQVVLEKRVAPEKTEDSIDVPSNLSKKTGSIKIKSSKGLSSSSLSPCNNVEKEVSMEKGVDEKKRGADSVKDSSPISDTKPSVQVKELSSRVPQQNKQELNTALEVIKKIMKMDAADPFNAPVNPIALGIPDYLDVIDTPMDFGTICSNIEKGVKYMNAEDVLKDVKFIWGNCYKYNNKGDYILELMKRVKKNFSKYWSAAGFSNELTRDNGGENNQSKELSSGKKGGNSKHKSKKRQNRVKRHKDDCLCAICVMMRRRQERESTQTDEEQKDTTDSPSGQEVKPEDNSPVESGGGGGGEGTSSSMDNSVDQDQDTEMVDKADAVKKEDTEQQQMISPVKETPAEECTDDEVIMKEADETSEHSELAERSEEHNKDQSATVENQNETQLGEMLMQEQHASESATADNQNPKQSLDKMEKGRILENLRRLENPMFLELCETLFSDNPKSIWSGPHSLIHHRQGPARSSPIHATVSTFLK